MSIITPPAVRRPNQPHAIWWRLVPLVTLGFGTWAAILYAGALLRRPGQGRIAAGYAALSAFALFAAVAGIGALAPYAVLAFLAAWLGGTVHTHLLDRQIRGLSDEEPAIRLARLRMARRRHVRHLVAAEPGMAITLRVGRPDLPRVYDDGGLVDVNHVPAAWLTRELDLPAAVVARLVAERDQRG